MRAGLRILLIAMALLGGMAPSWAERLTISGDVTYRERVDLPAGAVLSIGLVDLAKPDVSRVAARGAIATPGKVPLRFNLGFDDSVLSAGTSYGLIAEILGADNAVWFRTAQPYPVDPHTPPADLVVTVAFLGHAAAAATPTPNVIGVTWVAKTIAGNPTADGVESSLSIAEDMRAGGRGGCNSWFAQAELGDTNLAFSAVAATRMACASDAANAQETAWFDALGQTRFYHLVDDQLSLLDANGAEVATLVPATY